MRVLACGLLMVLASVGTVARADTIDDFVLSGNGQMITFSLPSVVYDTNTAPVPVSVATTAVGTLNGVGGAAISALFFTPALTFTSGLQLEVNGKPVGLDPNGTLKGPDVLAYIATGVPVSMGVPFVFIPGSYTESSPANAFYPNYQPFTLTITPEASSVPEPGGLLLVGTGCVCLLGAFAGRRSRLLGDR